MKASGRIFFIIASCLCAQISLDGVRAAVEYVPLEGDALYEFSWDGSAESARLAKDLALRPSEESMKAQLVDGLLPNELLGSGYTEELVSLTTGIQEKYTCVLPKTRTKRRNEEEELDSKYLQPESLLQPLQYQCLQLGQGYWSYELCHGQVLRQFHEENTGKGMKSDEYILGQAEKPWKPNLSEAESEDEREEDKEEKIPTWHFNGLDYPYYNVEMTGGTPCDLRGDNPRSVSILYICQTDAPTFGMLLLVEESTSCHYVAIVGTKQLCQNKAYRLIQQPVLRISCYYEFASPRKPVKLREQEFEVISMQPKTATTAGPAPKTSSGTQRAKGTSSPGPSLDESIILTFLTGEMCLRGGSGWWIHELCLMKQVKQIHLEAENSETQVVLGVWDEDLHKEWYHREGYKKKTKTSVSHIYRNGDVCDLTGKPRYCQVKFKCAKTKSPSQISLYLTEQSVCVYVLTVEGQFICQLLSQLDDHGMFQIRDSQSLFEKQPQADSSSDEVPQSQSSTESGQSRPSLESGQSHTGSESGQSQVDEEESSSELSSNTDHNSNSDPKSHSNSQKAAL